ncbi:hypothetical protein [Calidifontibacillus erzurumensis]|uniref:hypothetical protein n=1 Tax=Calidifontibacillus erzurumensis TaxID=2741433 RepID=UPI0035B53C01
MRQGAENTAEVKLIPEFSEIFEVINAKQEVVELVSSYNHEQQKNFFAVLKEVIHDDIALILMMFQANKLLKNHH